MPNTKSFSAALKRFYEVLDATTIACPGGRRVLDRAGAIALANAMTKLYIELTKLGHSVNAKYAQPCALPAGIWIGESDSPDGPWTPVPEEEVHTSFIPVGRGGMPAELQAAIERASLVTAFPLDRWNELQANHPGGPHCRYEAGDVITAQDLEILKSVELLVRLAGMAEGNESANAPLEIDDAAIVRLFPPESPYSPVGKKLPADPNLPPMLSVTEAARLLTEDFPGLTLPIARARVSKAASAGKFRTNGLKRNERRIDSDSLAHGD